MYIAMGYYNSINDLFLLVAPNLLLGAKTSIPCIHTFATSTGKKNCINNKIKIITYSANVLIPLVGPSL